MLNHNLKVHNEYLAKEQALPANASADGNGAVLRIDGTMGAIEFVAEVVTALGLATTKVASIVLQHSDSDDTGFEALGTLYSVTASGALTVDVGTELGRFVPPSNCKKFVKAVLTTDDAAASGTVNIYPTYLPR